LTETGGVAVIDGRWSLVYDRSSDGPSAGRYLEEALGERYGVVPGFSEDKNSRNSIVLNIDGSLENREGKEGYCLEILKDKVTINAASEAGLFYGVQTLLQVMDKTDSGAIEAKCIRIVDRPLFDIRGVHINAARYDSLKRQIDEMASMKMNFAIIESWDFYDLGDVSKKNSMAEVFEYARSRFIEPVPNLVSFSYSGPVVSKCPEAAEGIWVKDEVFVFKGGIAVPKMPTEHTLMNVIRDEDTDIVVRMQKE
jgi:hypothetical protein